MWPGDQGTQRKSALENKEKSSLVTFCGPRAMEHVSHYPGVTGVKDVDTIVFTCLLPLLAMAVCVCAIFYCITVHQQRIQILDLTQPESAVTFSDEVFLESTRETTAAKEATIETTTV